VSSLWIAVILIGILSVQQGYIYTLIRDRNIELKKLSENRYFQTLIESDLFVRRVSEIFVCKKGDSREFIIAFWEKTEGIRKFILYYFRTGKNDLIDIARRYVIDLDNIPDQISVSSLREYIRSIENGIYRRPNDRLYSSSIYKMCKDATMKEAGSLLHYSSGELNYYF
jgi:hypothetical protein